VVTVLVLSQCKQLWHPNSESVDKTASGYRDNPSTMEFPMNIAHKFDHSPSDNQCALPNLLGQVRPVLPGIGMSLLV
jgi:hypothetical protein